MAFSSWRQFKKTVFVAALGLFLRWGSFVDGDTLIYGPAWLIRAHYADKSDLYLGKINDVSNLQLVQQARSYMADLNRLDASGNFTAPEPLRTQGVRVSEKWFEAHHPDKVDFNPFDALLAKAATR